MLTDGSIQYELVPEGQYMLVHAYMPQGFTTSADIDVSCDDSKGAVSIHFDHVAAQLGCIQVPEGYTVGHDMGAKFSKSKRRFTFRLYKAGPSSPDLEDRQSDQASAAAGNSGPRSPGPEAGDVNTFTVEDDIDAPLPGMGQDVAGGSAGGDAAAAATGGSGAKKKKRKKKGGQAADAAEACDDTATANATPRSDQALEEGAAGVAAEAGEMKSKRRRGQKKKKKKKGKAAQPGQQDEHGSDSEGLGDEVESDGGASAECDAAASDGSGELAAEDAPSQAPSSPAAQVPATDPLSAQPDVCSEPTANVTLRAELEPRPLQGPAVRYCLAKQQVKGEDKWLQEASNSWQHVELEAAAPFAAFGVFDGHGGKESVNYAARHLLPKLADLLAHPACAPGQQPGSMEGGGDAEGSLEDRQVWAAQEALLEVLPQALHTAFVGLDAECRQRFARSGTTATVAVAVGWEVVIANVGDSVAYLDTGDQVVKVSGDHRLENNAEEVARVLVAGGEVCQSSLKGKPVGPQRVWPGGLAMSRSLGDREAGDLVPGEPEVRQVSLPATGARLIIASDGLWDCVLHPKMLMHQLRGMPATVAVERAKMAALNKKGLRDDITILIADFVPNAADKLPPSLNASCERVHESLAVCRPLSPGGAGAWRARLAARRAAAAAQQAHLAALVAAAAAEAEARATPAATAAPAASPMPVESDTYRELAALRLDPAALMASLAEEQAAAVAEGEAKGAGAAGEDQDGDWTAVGRPQSVRDQLRAAAQRQSSRQRAAPGARPLPPSAGVAAAGEAAPAADAAVDGAAPVQAGERLAQGNRAPRPHRVRREGGRAADAPQGGATALDAGAQPLLTADAAPSKHAGDGAGRQGAHGRGRGRGPRPRRFEGDVPRRFDGDAPPHGPPGQSQALCQQQQQHGPEQGSGVPAPNGAVGTRGGRRYGHRGGGASRVTGERPRGEQPPAAAQPGGQQPQQAARPIPDVRVIPRPQRAARSAGPPVQGAGRVAQPVA